MKQHIAFVDDEPLLLKSLGRMLKEYASQWELHFFTDPEVAWEYVYRALPDVVVCDIAMPKMDGLELLQQIKSRERTFDIPVIILTGLGDRSLKRRALELGADDLLTKPVETEDLVARLRNAVRIRQYHKQLKAHAAFLEQKVQEQTARLLQARLEIVWRLAAAAECHDVETGNHVIRVGCLSRAIAEQLVNDCVFVETIFLAAPLHDVGKLGIPDSILLKPGPLTDEERHIMQRHCVLGEQLLRKVPAIRDVFVEWYKDPLLDAVAWVGDPILSVAATIALMHHERWDGKGYPQGLKREEIALEARIVALADVFDALMSKRPYKDPYGMEQSVEIVTQQKGKHFDPAVVDAFLKTLPEVERVYQRFADEVVECAVEAK